MAKSSYTFPGTDVMVEADLTPLPKMRPRPEYSYGLLAIHKPLGGGKGYILTHSPTGTCLLKAAKKAEAVEARRTLESNWSDEVAEAFVTAWRDKL